VNAKPMAGKVCLITGASSGIGRETARALAAMGACVVMLCRNREKGEQVQKDISEKTGNDSVNMMTADLASQRQIHQFAADFKARYSHLNVLINNAGSILGSRRLTEDGIEKTFAENHLGHFLLTHLLLDLIQSSAPARIINVSSMVHRGINIDFGDIFLAGKYSPMKAYRQSKLANILFTYHLAEKLAGSGVTVNCLHPGAVASNFGNNSSRAHRALIALAKPFLLSPQKGAETSIYLASSAEVAGISGKYFIKKKPAKSSRGSYDPEVQKKLWAVSEQMTAPPSFPQ